MALFRRNKTEPVVLPELEKYYDAERRERSGLAWILALVSVAGVALVLIGLFFGGRWIYRNLTDDKKPTVAVVQTKNNTSKTDTTKNNDKPKTDTEVKPTTTPTTTPATTPSTSTPSANPVAPAKPSNKPTTPATKPSSLTNTGPESVIPYFIIATVIGTLGYRLKLSKT